MFIKLTDVLHNKPIFINIDKIISIQQTSEKVVILYGITATIEKIVVEETIEEIEKKLNDLCL